MHRLVTLSACAAAGFLLAGCPATGPRPYSKAAGGARCADTVRVAETRIVTAAEADKLTLGAAVDRMSQSLLRAPEGSAWKPEAARAIEIRDSRTDLSILVEDAEWVLALQAALDGPLPSEDKARLRRLHERYAAHAPHAEIAAQVTTLLETVRDENLRRELKKLANRSWERERRHGARAAEAAKVSSPAPAPSSPSLPLDAPAVPADASARAQADSSDSGLAPERYCADRRAEAARSFAEGRNATDGATRERLLRQSIASLDACITRFPDAAEAAKARGNRARVAGELKR
jgi:hypothetical protein